MVFSIPFVSSKSRIVSSGPVVLFNALNGIFLTTAVVLLALLSTGAIVDRFVSVYDGVIRVTKTVKMVIFVEIPIFSELKFVFSSAPFLLLFYSKILSSGLILADFSLRVGNIDKILSIGIPRTQEA